MAQLARSTRITGKERTALTLEIKRHYAKGVPIRALAAKYGRSYGFVHTLLSEAGVPIRARGSAPGQRRRRISPN